MRQMLISSERHDYCFQMVFMSIDRMRHCKLEVKVNSNHFVLKSRLYFKALKAAYHGLC